MKKLVLIATAAFLSAAAVSAFVYVNNGKNSMGELFNANVEALSANEGSYVCTGPKTENLNGHIFCHSTNPFPCKDMYGCQ